MSKYKVLAAVYYILAVINTAIAFYKGCTPFSLVNIVIVIWLLFCMLDTIERYKDENRNRRVKY